MQQGDSLHQPLINILLLLPITLRIELKLPTYRAEIICTPPHSTFISYLPITMFQPHQSSFFLKYAKFCHTSEIFPEGFHA